MNPDDELIKAVEDAASNLIKFTQYMRPNGRKVTQHLQVSSETKKLADALVEEGCTFAAEVLLSSHVAVYIEYDGDDLLTRICDNGTEVTRAVENMVSAAAKLLNIKLPEEK